MDDWVAVQLRANATALWPSSQRFLAGETEDQPEPPLGYAMGWSWAATKAQQRQHYCPLCIGHREGDLYFQLCWNSEVIFSITIVLRVDRRNWQLLITRLQGSQTDFAQEMIKNATKGLHGLRPADLLLQMARHLAGVLKCTEVVMVSNQHRVALNPVRRLKIKFDADKFWIEKGASKSSDGLYALSPEVEIRSDFSDIPSNKRAQAKRRAEVLRQALDALSSALNSLNKRRD